MKRSSSGFTRVSSWSASALVVCLLWVLCCPARANPCEAPFERGGVGGTGAPAGAMQEDASLSRDEGREVTSSSGNAAAVDRDKGGVGGTGVPAAKGGVGGTGKPAGEDGLADDKGGVGGTGIVGVITGFGSICVNGVEVEYDATTPVSIDGQTADASAFAIGQLVQVETQGQGPTYKASRVRIDHAVIGPVSRTDARAMELEILGQKVNVDRRGWEAALRAQGEGKPVKVSGIRRSSGKIEATLVTPAPMTAAPSVLGMVTAVPDGSLRIGALKVQAAGLSSPRVLEGRTIAVSGRLEGGTLRAERLAVMPEALFAGRMDRLLVQGFVEQRNLDRVRVSGTEVRLPRDLRVQGGSKAELTRDQAVILDVRKDKAGRLSVHNARILRALPGLTIPERLRRGSIPGTVTPAGGTAGEQHGRTTVAPGEGAGSKGRKDDRADDPKPSVPQDTDRPIESGEDALRPEKVEGAEAGEKAEPSERPERPESAEKAEKVEKAEKPARAEKAEKVEKPERIEKPEKAEKPEKVERIEKPEKVERPEKVEKPEKVERPERIEKPEKVERPEKVEKPEKPEKPETPER